SGAAAKTTPRPKKTRVGRLGGVDHQVVEALRAFSLIAVSDFLALDTERRPRHGCETLRTDVLFTMQTHPESSFFDAAQCTSHIPQQIRFAIEITDRQLPLGGMLYFVESIGTLFDSNAFAVAHK